MKKRGILSLIFFRVLSANFIFLISADSDEEKTKTEILGKVIKNFDY